MRAQAFAMWLTAIAPLGLMPSSVSWLVRVAATRSAMYSTSSGLIVTARVALCRFFTVSILTIVLMPAYGSSVCLFMITLISLALSGYPRLSLTRNLSIWACGST